MKKWIFIFSVFYVTALHAQESGCVEGNCETGKGKIVYTNGHIYTGEFVDGNREGRGFLKSPEGESYDGMWKDDQFYGQGTFVWANGAKYTGEWKNGIRDGYGIYFFPNGDKYTGYFKNNNFHGKGTYTWADGTSQEGTYENGQLKN